MGRGAGGLLFHSLCGPVERKKALDVGGPSFDRFYLFLAVEKEAAGRGAQRPVWGGSEFKKTGARTRGQNPLVLHIQIYNDDVIVYSPPRLFPSYSEHFSMEN